MRIRGLGLTPEALAAEAHTTFEQRSDQREAERETREQQRRAEEEARYRRMLWKTPLTVLAVAIAAPPVLAAWAIWIDFVMRTAKHWIGP